MPSPPFPPRPAPIARQEDPYGHGHSRGSSNHPHHTPNDAPCTPRSILRPTLPSYMHTPHDATVNSQIPHPQPPPISRGTTTSPYHHHTSSSPELRPRVDSAWAPRGGPYPQQQPADLSHTRNAHNSTHHHASHVVSRPRLDQNDVAQRRSGFVARVSQHFVPGIRGRSASDIRIVHTPPPDLDPDRLARACGQPTLPNVYQQDLRGRQGAPLDSPSTRLKDSSSARNGSASPSHPLPKIRVGHMYRRLDALARRSGRRAMDYVGFEDVAVIHKRDNQLREQLRRKRSERLQEKDPNFHAIGAPLEDVLLYASTMIVIGDLQYHLPVVVVACIEELTKNGIYQSGLFRALPSRDRHLQLIDLYDKSPDFGAHFNMRGQAMPDICALLSTFISSLPAPLLDGQIYSALWHWSVKPSVKREDARRDQQEEDEEDRRAKGELPPTQSFATHFDFYRADTDSALETDQISIAQILLRFLPSANLSLLVYLCGFFTQLPLCPENGLQLEDVARIFGHRLLGGSTKMVSQRMMLWLLTRWHRISETLFGDMCGMTPPSSPSGAAAQPTVANEESSRERAEKRKGNREGGPDDAVRHTASSSSSHSSPSTASQEGVSSSRKSSSSDVDEGADSAGASRRRKKRELDVPERTRSEAGRPPTSRKESRHGHAHGRRPSGSRRHHHGRASEHKEPDPFAMAFAKAQHELVESPLLTPPFASVHVRGQAGNDARSRLRTSQFEHDVRHSGSGGGGADVDMRVVDALLQETAVATDVALALAERVEVLERALQVRRVGDGLLVEHPPIGHPPGGEADDRVEGEGEDRGDGASRANGEDKNASVNGDVEDGLRLQLRLVEAERDRAQRIVRGVKAYLLDEVSTLQRG